MPREAAEIIGAISIILLALLSPAF